MIEGLRPYPGMRDSGVAWLGQVPAHWDVAPNRKILAEVNERDHPAEQMLSVTIRSGVVPQEALLAASSKKDSSNIDRSAYKLVLPGDIVYNKMRAWQGAVGVSGFRGIVSPAYVVHRPRGAAQSRYLHYLLRTPGFAKEAERWSYGITSDMWSLRPEHFRRIYACLPPPAEQTLVVRFVDYIDATTRRYLSTRLKLIQLVREQTQAIVHRAVSRGIDRDVRLKPSGNTLLEDVPAHWVARRLKDVAVVQTGITLGKDYGNAELVDRPYLRVANVQAGRLDLRTVLNLRVPPAEAARSTLRSGDVLMTEGGDIDKLGRGCLWRDEVPNCLHQNHVFAVRPRASQLLPGFLEAVMGSPHGRSYFQSTAKQTTNLAATNGTTLGNLPMRLPDVDEQQRILDWIEAESLPLVLAVDRVQREIIFIREYRARLIADVVTGKVDARRTARQLPDETIESRPHDVTPSPIEDDEENADEALIAEPVEA